MNIRNLRPCSRFQKTVISLLHLGILLSSFGSVQSIPLDQAGGDDVLRQRSTALSTCLSGKNITVRFPNDPGFQDLARPYNLQLSYTPAAIVLASTTQHVSDAVVCASKNNVKVQAKSGGHSYASFSSGGTNGVLVVDLEPMQTISVDNSTNIATVGGGVRLGNLAVGLYNQGKRALPHGTCPGVGVGGHASHGGYGYTSRKWGLALDTIVALDVVLADGTSFHCDQYHHGDVYYALRGAADSFGIITNFYFQTQKAHEEIVYFSYSFPTFLDDATQAAKYFMHLQAFALNSSVVDDNFTFGMYMDADSFALQGQYFGQISRFNSVIKVEMLRGLPDPIQPSAKKYGWLDALTILAGGPLQQPLTGYDQHDTFYAKSIVSQEAQPLTQQAMEAFFGYIINNGQNLPFGWFVIINLYGGPGSAINKKSQSFSAYSDRSSLWVFQNYGYSSNHQPPLPSGVEPFITSLTQSLLKAQSNGNFEAYVNYVDPSLSPADAHKLYYGDQTYARLLSIKQSVDPGKVFWNPQAIGN